MNRSRRLKKKKKGGDEVTHAINENGDDIYKGDVFYTWEYSKCSEKAHRL